MQTHLHVEVLLSDQQHTSPLSSSSHTCHVPLILLCLSRPPHTNHSTSLGTQSYDFFKYTKARCNSLQPSLYFSISILKANAASVVPFLGIKQYCCWFHAWSSCNWCSHIKCSIGQVRYTLSILIEEFMHSGSAGIGNSLCKPSLLYRDNHAPIIEISLSSCEDCVVWIHAQRQNLLAYQKVEKSKCVSKTQNLALEESH